MLGTTAVFSGLQGTLNTMTYTDLKGTVTHWCLPMTNEEKADYLLGKGYQLIPRLTRKGFRTNLVMALFAGKVVVDKGSIDNVMWHDRMRNESTTNG